MKKYGILSIILSALIFLIISNSQIAKEGAISGIKLCENTIIPALLPVLILTNLISNSKCSYIFERIFGFICVRLFKLPKCTAPAIIFGLIGGYPAGAILTNNLYQNAMIDKNTMSRIMRFNFSGGLAFIITAVGQIRYSSLETGIILFISCITPSILIAIINGLFIKKTPDSSNALKNTLSINEALIKSVETATKSILTMCAYIILFSALCSIFSIPKQLLPIIEITNGIFYSKDIPLDYVAFFLSFGGLCIHFQIMEYLNSKYLDFLVFRTINAILSYLIMHFYLILHPIEQSVFCNQSSITASLTQANAGFGIIMIIGCAVIILDVENRKLKLR